MTTYDIDKLQEELVKVQNRISWEVLSGDRGTEDRQRAFTPVTSAPSSPQPPASPILQPVPRRMASLASTSNDLAGLPQQQFLLPQQAQLVQTETHGKCVEEVFALGCRKFSLEPSMGLQYLEQHDFFPMQPPSSQAVAKFIWDAQRLHMIKKSCIGSYLSAPDTFNQQVLKQYVKLVNFYDSDSKLKSLLDSMRSFLKTFQLPGESQQIDRIVTAFSARYADLANRSATTPLQKLFCDADITYLVAFSLILLNTDLHNTQNKYKMNKRTFIDINSKLLMQESQFDDEFMEDEDSIKQVIYDHLEACYESVYHKPLKVAQLDENEEFPLFMLSQQSGYLNVNHGLIWNSNQKFCFISSGCLFYYASSRSDDAYVMIPLVNCRIRVIPFSEHSWFTRVKEKTFGYRVYSFEVSSSQRLRAVKIVPGQKAQLLQETKFVFEAKTLDDRQKWIQALEATSSTYSFQ